MITLRDAEQEQEQHYKEEVLQSMTRNQDSPLTEEEWEGQLQVQRKRYRLERALWEMRNVSNFGNNIGRREKTTSVINASFWRGRFFRCYKRAEEDQSQSQVNYQLASQIGYQHMSYRHK